MGRSSNVSLLLLINLSVSKASVCQAIQDCHAAVHAMGVPRIATDVRIGTRIDRENKSGQVNVDKVKRVEDILGNMKKLEKE